MHGCKIKINTTVMYSYRNVPSTSTKNEYICSPKYLINFLILYMIGYIMDILIVYTRFKYDKNAVIFRIFEPSYFYLHIDFAILILCDKLHF